MRVSNAPPVLFTKWLRQVFKSSFFVNRLFHLDVSFYGQIWPFIKNKKILFYKTENLPLQSFGKGENLLNLIRI
ncbi:hypothetical protein ADIS_2798 [Lunatimonas lonarensis]|uniref:Uncharacterized protein n=1 Tax=Lunatimonas lonarensis TaxID=1232681 RepID=R7ZRW8_9BACT|nr:hypothetical protein ADIS_2798 [Lunatimonas lonarensis]